jgi:amino acid permease
MSNNLLSALTASDGDKDSSLVVIFSCWKTMIGTAVAALPWTFQQSGIILGLILCFTSFIISFYTCKLIIDMAGNDSDYSETLRKYYGKLICHLLS